MRITSAVVLMSILPEALVAQVPAAGTAPGVSATSAAQTGMIFLYHADPRFLAGLERHGLLHDYGLRVHNTGMQQQAFGPKWAGSQLLARARASGLPFYVDRISGGMPYQPLEGIESIADSLADDPRFMGFQVHEWGNSPIADYKRIRDILIDKGMPFDREHFARYEGRIRPPYLGGGDFEVYRELFRPLDSLGEIDKYLEAYLAGMIRRTRGQVMAVNGYIQLYHSALRLGAKNVMAEIGNQVPLTALQMASVRGAARQYGKPFGVYYEPWGGRPFGCPCAMDFSPWFEGSGLKREEWKALEPNIGEGFGSSLSLMRRLMWFSLLSGASWYAEEWGAENYFANWEDYPLTEYGRVVKQFREEAGRLGRLEPIVPAAIVLPPATVGVDLKYVGGRRDKLHDLVEPDLFHRRLRQFAIDVLGVRPTETYDESNNLTASPWIGCFDVVTADAGADVLSRYRLSVFFDEQQHAASGSPANQDCILYTGRPQEAEFCTAAIAKSLPARVEGRVGCVWARGRTREGPQSEKGICLGLFNNLGVTKTRGREDRDASAVQEVKLSGRNLNARVIGGDPLEIETSVDGLSLRIPAGGCVVLQLQGHP